jgi:hypothetical protein
LTAGGAAAAPPRIEIRADPFKELRNGELKAADARRPECHRDLPLSELIRRMDDAAATLARASDNEGCFVSVEIKNECAVACNRGNSSR